MDVKSKNGITPPTAPAKIHYTDIVQMPFIFKEGFETPLSPDMMKLNEQQMRDLAKVLDGELGYKKVRATYTELENSICTWRDCWRPTQKGNKKCDGHSKP